MNQNIKLDVDLGECALVIRSDTSVETYARLGTTIEASELLAMGLSWALENEEWKAKLMRRARHKILAIIEEGRSADQVTLIDTHT